MSPPPVVLFASNSRSFRSILAKDAEKIVQEVANQQLAKILEGTPQLNQTKVQFDIVVNVRHSLIAMMELRRAHRRRKCAESADAQVSAEEIERLCKGEDNADLENFKRMEEQKLMPRPLIFKAKCSSASASSGSGTRTPAQIVSYDVNYATDEELRKAESENMVRSVCELQQNPLLHHLTQRNKIVPIFSQAEIQQEVSQRVSDPKLAALVQDVAVKRMRGVNDSPVALRVVAVHSVAGDGVLRVDDMSMLMECGFFIL